MNERNITINILPQSPQAWLFIAIAVGALAISSCAKGLRGPNEIRIAEIESKTQIEIAKIQAHQ